MFRKSQAARRDWAPAALASCAARQEQILEQAARLVRPAGRLVYSTCTFAPEENEAVIARFLERHPDFDLAKAPALPGLSPGRPEWLDSTSRNLERGVRIWPHLSPGEGHFIAILQNRSAPAGIGARQPSKIRRAAAQRPARPPAETLALLARFTREHLDHYPNPDRLCQFGSYLYELPEKWELPPGLNSLHPGRWLGVIKSGRFEPAHALAMSLPPNQAYRMAPTGLEEARRYLRGEPLEHAGPPGWVLVTYAGYALGWGKRVGSVVKNLLPKGLRQV
jgi:NOL1/NOP2/fmu family ribosome biogenesis protein